MQPSTDLFDPREFETQQQIDTAIACRMQALERVTDELLALRIKRNRIAPSISCLPPEILASIFVEVVLSARLARRSTYSSQVAVAGIRWLYMTHVCKHWRDVALGTAHLWSHLPLQHPIDCVQEFIRRSSTAPLHVVSEISIFEPADLALCKLLSPEVYRIQELSLAISRSLCQQLEAQIPAISDAPLLKRLCLTKCSSPSEEPDPESFWFSNAALEHLEDLELAYFSVSFIRPFFRPTLTRLAVRFNSQQPQETRLGAAQWIEILTQIPLLQELVLESAVPVPPSGTFVQPPLHDGLSLPYLRNLKLTDYATGSTEYAALVAQLNIPPLCDIYFGSTSTGLISTEEPRYITSVLTSKFTPSKWEGDSRDQPLRYCTISVSPTSFDFAVKAWSDVLSPRPDDVLNEVDHSGIHQRPPYMHLGLTLELESEDDFPLWLEFLPSSRIISLNICDQNNGITTFQDLLSSFQLIRHLSYSSNSTVSYNNLVQYLTPRPEADDTSSEIRLADLNSLTMSYIDWHESNGHCRDSPVGEPLLAQTERMVLLRHNARHPLSELTFDNLLHCDPTTDVPAFDNHAFSKLSRGFRHTLYMPMDNLQCSACAETPPYDTEVLEPHD